MHPSSASVNKIAQNARKLRFSGIFCCFHLEIVSILVIRFVRFCAFMSQNSAIKRRFLRLILRLIHFGEPFEANFGAINEAIKIGIEKQILFSTSAWNHAIIATS